MVQQITKGIKISVRPNFEGVSLQGNKLFYTFSYSITIENKSNVTVQLLRRYWEIYDALKKTETVSGDGVVGKRPSLGPNRSYTYTSYCHLSSVLGSMKGHYEMVNLTNNKIFQVAIPTFQLAAPVVVN